MGKGVTVFGSFAADLTTRQNGLPLPGETIRGDSFHMGPGGKGSNQAVAAHRAGADVTLITKVGKDVFGRVALDFYEKEGMSRDCVLVSDEYETGVALILVDQKSAQNEIVIVPGACARIAPEDVENVRSKIENAGVLLTQLEVNYDATFAALEIAKKAGVRAALNPAPAGPVPDEVLRGLYCVTPNETEAKTLTGVAVNDRAGAEKAAKVFLDKGVQNVVITLGAQGVFVTDGQRSELLPRIPVDAVDTTGAGDAFSGAFATALSEGMDLFSAARFGNAGGALSVTKIGTAPAAPYRAEIDKLVKSVYGG